MSNANATSDKRVLQDAARRGVEHYLETPKITSGQRVLS
jgi:hypothetical protein